MCTAATYKDDNGFYFGRTLDYEFAYGEEVVVVPRNYAFKLRHMPALNSHYSIIGMAHVARRLPAVLRCGKRARSGHGRA